MRKLLTAFLGGKRSYLSRPVQDLSHSHHGESPNAKISLRKGPNLLQEYAEPGSMIDLEAVRLKLDLERRTLAQEGCTLEILPYVSRTEAVNGTRKGISFSSLSDTDADAIIAEQVAYYRSLGTEVEWKAYGYDSPSDLLQRLERHGFEIGPRETVLVLGLHDPPDWLDEPTSQHIVRVDDVSQVDLFRNAAEDIFKKSYELTADELRAAINAGSTDHCAYMVMDGNITTSIGRLYTQSQSAFGGLYGGGTLEQYRGRGLYRATVAARARDAIKAGARYLIVDALPTSQPILERLGFVRLTDTWPCTLNI